MEKEGRRYIFKIVPSLNNLVDDVRFSESWVVLDDGLDSLADSWGRWDYGSWGSGNSGYWGSSGVGGGSVWVSFTGSGRVYSWTGATPSKTGAIGRVYSWTG